MRAAVFRAVRNSKSYVGSNEIRAGQLTVYTSTDVFKQLQIKIMDWTIESIDDTMVKISHPTFRTGVGDMALPYMSDTFDVLRYSSM